MPGASVLRSHCAISVVCSMSWQQHQCIQGSSCRGICIAGPEAFVTCSRSGCCRSANCMLRDATCCARSTRVARRRQPVVVCSTVLATASTQSVLFAELCCCSVVQLVCTLFTSCVIAERCIWSALPSTSSLCWDLHCLTMAAMHSQAWRGRCHTEQLLLQV